MMYVVMFTVGFMVCFAIDTVRMAHLKSQLKKVAENKNTDAMFAYGINYAIDQIERWIEL